MTEYLTAVQNSGFDSRATVEMCGERQSILDKKEMA